MSARLVALGDGPDIPLDGALPIVLGRGPQCDFQLPFSRVSRRHCAITLVDAEVEVRDLGSSNGTLINGRQVVSGTLHQGDVLSIAGIRFRLDLGVPTRLSWMMRVNDPAPSGELRARQEEAS